MSQREHIERTSCSEVLKNLILKTEDTGFEDEKHYWNILNKGFPVYMHMHPCLCAHIYVQSMCVFVQSIGVCLCVCPCAHTDMHVCACVCIPTHVPMHACVCARVHVQSMHMHRKSPAVRQKGLPSVPVWGPTLGDLAVVNLG